MEREAKGNCYDTAVHTAMELWERLAGWPHARATIYVCHGTVTGQGPIAGLRMGHAWVEYGDVCLDFSNGAQVTMPKNRYYALAEASNVHRYHVRETLTNLNRHGHYGPWHKEEGVTDGTTSAQGT